MKKIMLMILTISICSRSISPVENDPFKGNSRKRTKMTVEPKRDDIHEIAYRSEENVFQERNNQQRRSNVQQNKQRVQLPEGKDYDAFRNVGTSTAGTTLNPTDVTAPHISQKTVTKINENEGFWKKFKRWLHNKGIWHFEDIGLENHPKTTIDQGILNMKQPKMQQNRRINQ